jgi:PAS domain S-box-containing protein
MIDIQAPSIPKAAHPGAIGAPDARACAQARHRANAGGVLAEPPERKAASTRGAAPAGLAAGGVRAGLQLRLVIALPVLLALMVIAQGAASYVIFKNHGDEIDKLGAGRIAEVLLNAHMVSMLVLTAVGIVCGLGLALAILRPIRALMEAARRVAEGALDQRAPSVNAAPELEALSRSFNEMIDRLNAAMGERNRMLVEGLPLGILTTDLQGRVTAASPAAADMLGLPVSALTGRTVLDLIESVRQETRALMTRVAHDLQGDDATLPGGVRANYRLTRASLRDGHGQAVGHVFSFRRPGAVDELSAHLRRTDELASLGAFALGLAHQLRNPLAAVKGLSQLLQSDRDLPDRAAEYLARMNAQVDRVDRFVGQLLSYSESPASDPPTPTDLAQALREALEIACRQAGTEPAKAARVICAEALTPLPAILIERKRVTDALAQVVKNALKFSPEGGAITLSSQADPDGRWGAVRVHNAGPAIAPENRERVFEPFFTTDERATGLGLTFAREIVAQNGGALLLEPADDGVAFVARFGADRLADANGDDCDRADDEAGKEARA